MTFKERADLFWNWFAAQEETLSDMATHPRQYGSQRVADFVGEGIALLAADAPFNLGGDHEFTFAVEGQEHLFYLLPYLINRRPAGLHHRWQFFPSLQSSHGRSFDFGMYGIRVSTQDIQVSMGYDPEAAVFNLRFYHPALCSLEEEPCYNAFYILMELTIGESLSYLYMGDVQQAAGPEADMFPLTQLEGRMEEAIDAMGHPRFTRPDERYTSYQLHPQPGGGLRQDVIAGVTCYTSLLNDYYAGRTGNADALAACGAKACFLFFHYGDEDRRDVLQVRYDLEDRLQRQVLGPRGSGEEIGVVLGGALGETYAYIDLLLYDAPAFLQQVQPLLASLPYDFSLADFDPEGEVTPLYAADGRLN